MIETKNLKRSFKNGDQVTEVLKGVDFVARDGEYISIMGRSGAGKSTFLYQLSLLDHPTSGEVLIDGKKTETLSSNERMKMRLRTFGYVFQDYALMPDLTAMENVALPLLMMGHAHTHAHREATHALELVGVGHRPGNLPSQLSGGEQQRVSIARAIAHKPKVLFADEPTANLDNESSRAVMDIFDQLHKAGQTIIMVTHEEEYAKRAERLIKFDDGHIVAETHPRKRE
jgi:putative ABC transport system ATP-binding protein